VTVTLTVTITVTMTVTVTMTMTLTIITKRSFLTPLDQSDLDGINYRTTANYDTAIRERLDFVKLAFFDGL